MKCDRSVKVEEVVVGGEVELRAWSLKRREDSFHSCRREDRRGEYSSRSVVAVA